MNEEVKNFVIKDGIKTGDPAVDQYIQDLHEYILSFEASNIKKLILATDRLAGVIAEDIDKIIQGEDETEDEMFTGYDEDDEPVYEKVTKSNLKVLSDSKDSKVYDRILNLISKIESFEKVSKAAKSLIPVVEEFTEKTQDEELVKELKLTGSENNFEEMQTKHLSKRAGREIV